MFTINGKEITTVDKEIDKRLNNAIASVFENRLPVFLPIRKLRQAKITIIFEKNNNEISFATNYGVIKVRNRIITQNHKNYLEAMLMYKKKMLVDESFYTEFTVYDLLANKLHKKNPTDYKTFKKYLKELKDIHITIEIKDKDKNIEIGFGLVDDYMIDNNTGKYKVKFSRILSKIWQNEHLIKYKTSNILVDKIDIPIVQYVVRYLITYNNLKIKLDKLFEKLNLNKVFSKRDVYNKIQEVKESFRKYKEYYEELGILFDEETELISIDATKNKILLNYSKKQTFSSKLIKAN